MLRINGSYISFENQRFKRKILSFLLSPYFIAAKLSLYQANFLTAITPTFLNWCENFSKNYNQYNQPLYLVPEIKKVSKTQLDGNLIWWQTKLV